MHCQCTFVQISCGLAVGDTYAERLEKVLGLLVNVELTAVAVLGEVESGDFRNVLILALTLLLLKLEGNTADRTTLNTLHQVGGVSGNLFGRVSTYVYFCIPRCIVISHLVPQPLGRNNGDLIADALVGLEVEGELRVVALDDDLGRLLDRLRPDATHVCGIGWVLVLGCRWWWA